MIRRKKMKTKLLSLLSVIVFSTLTPLHGLCAPWVNSVSPTSGWNEQDTNITVYGTGFEAGAVASLHRSGPDVVGWCSAPFPARGIWVSGQYAYVATGMASTTHPSRLEIIDISVPSSPALVGSWEIDPAIIGDPSGWWTPPLKGIYVSGNYAYLTGYAATGGLWIVDISDPTNPTLAGYNLSYVAFGSDVKVSGDYAYLCAVGGLVILNVSNPQNITLEGYCTPPDHSTQGIQLSGDHAYVAYFDPSPGWLGGVDVFNISDPSAPYLEGTYDTGDYCFDIAVSGNYAYLPNQEDGFFVIDISDPANPYEVGSNQSIYGHANIDVSGGLAYVAISGGSLSGQLKVLSIADPHNPFVIHSFDTGSTFAMDVHISRDYAYVAAENYGLRVIESPRLLDAYRVSDTEITATVPAGVAPGLFDLYITNLNGQGDMLDSGFTVMGADFEADPLTGSWPLTVQFTDKSTGPITSWSWNLGDGGTSMEQNPSYEYTEAGDYTVSLTVTAPGEVNTETKTDYIQVFGNRRPELDPIGDQVVTEGELLEFTITASDPDNDGLDYSASNLPGGASFDTETQTFSWTPDFGQAGSYPNVVFTVTDDGTPPLSDSETITITVRVVGANTFYVPDDFTTIQEAIDDVIVIDGDTIIVRDGTYYEIIDFLGKAITVQSENGPSTTIIDGGATGPVVAFLNGEGAESVLDGFTITNGLSSFGGGISAMENSPTILNCIITGNESPFGGGVFDYGENGATITDCTIINNTAFVHGGGVYTISAKVTNCTIRDNVASDAGGGISFGFGDTYPSSAIIANCIINNNTAGSVGGGIRCDDLSPTIVNCTVSNNSATANGGGIYCSGSNGPTVVNSIFWGNTAGGSPNEVSAGTIDITYSDIEGGWTGTGNIDSDPLFVDPGYGDFHLQSSSPCMNVGNNSAVPPGLTTDFEGDERIFDNGTVDMGVDEFDPTVVRANFRGDPTAGAPSLVVNFTDHSTGSPTAWSWDFDNDGGEDSSVQNPSFTYTSEGTYTVSLTVTGGVQDTVTKTDYITVALPPVAGFTADPTSGPLPLTVQFTDQSMGSITAWSWDFGDGGTSTQDNPSYQYTQVGDYTVSLTVTGPGGEDIETKTDYIHVVEPAPVAAFSGAPTSGDKPLEVTFTDASTGPITTWSWDFGDGQTSTQQNPSHTYTDVGDFTVSLAVTGPGGEDTEVKQNYIHVSGPICECDIVPDTTDPIPRGGTLGFQASVTNNTDVSGPVYFATKVRLPSGYMYPSSGFFDGPYQLWMTPHGSKSGHLSHNTTGWPVGPNYIYRGLVGQLTGEVYDTCEFAFEVIDSLPDKPVVNSIDPVSGPCDTVVEITGNNFGDLHIPANRKVIVAPVGDVASQYQLSTPSWTNTRIEAQFPCSTLSPGDYYVAIFTEMGWSNIEVFTLY
jgi:parallel beta-helix repeat protein